MNLGAPRLGRRLHLLAGREHPRDPTAGYYRLRAVMERRGTLAAVDHFRHAGIPDNVAAVLRAEWLSMRATVCATYRDFDTAD